MSDNNQRVVAARVPGAIVARLVEATRRGDDPVAPLDGAHCISCDSRAVVACGVFRQLVAREREFEVVMACRDCGEFATLEPRVTYRAG